MQPQFPGERRNISIWAVVRAISCERSAASATSPTMSMTIAPESDRTPKAETFRDYRGKLWRIVEAQHRISTNRLASGGDEQALLEQLVEEVKPAQPVAARHLHYLLATPVRYGHKRSSRFRHAGGNTGKIGR